MLYVIMYYIATGLVVGLVSINLEWRLVRVGEKHVTNSIVPPQWWYCVYFAIFGILFLPSIFSDLARLRDVANRGYSLRDIFKATESLGLKEFDPITITSVDGHTRYAGFSSMNEKRYILHWYIPGTAMSGGGWDASSSLSEIRKIERAEKRSGVIW